MLQFGHHHRPVISIDSLKDAVIRRTEAMITRANTYNADINAPGENGRTFLERFISAAQQLQNKCAPVSNKRLGL